MSAKDVQINTLDHHEHASEDLHDIVHHPDKWMSWKVGCYLTIVGLSMGLYGYDNNFAAPLLQIPLFIVKYQGVALTFSADNLNLIITVPLVGAAIGTFLAPPLLYRLGRKWTLIIAYTLLCTPGSFLQLFAPNVAALVVGRFWNYLGISILTTAAPLYLSELVPPHVRGRAIGFCVAGVSAVGVLATVVVWGTSKLTDDRSYKIPLALQAALPAALALLSFLLPESPLWKVQHGKLEEATQILMQIRNNNRNVVEKELVMIQTAVASETERVKNSRFWEILDRENIKRTLTAGALLSLSQVCGQILVMTYSTVALVQSGVANPFQITIIISCTMFLGTVIGPALVDKAGRRPVALVGFTILAILNFAAGGLAAAGLKTKSERLGLAATFILFGFFNAVSFQSLAFLLPTEIPTPSLREPTMAWSIFWSYCTAVITTFAVPRLMNADGANLGAQTAFVFGGFAIVAVVWSYFFVPETKARTLAEIDEMYHANLPMRKWRGYKCEATIIEVEPSNKGLM